MHMVELRMKEYNINITKTCYNPVGKLIQKQRNTCDTFSNFHIYIYIYVYISTPVNIYISIHA